MCILHEIFAYIYIRAHVYIYVDWCTKIVCLLCTAPV